jgi:hypothetical protein
VRGLWRISDPVERPYQVRKESTPRQIGRYLYLLLGVFFVLTEFVYFFEGIDWLSGSARF